MELLDFLDSLWNSKDVLDLTMPTRDRERKTASVFMMGERDVTRPPEPTGIRRPGHRRARTDSPVVRRNLDEADRLIEPDPTPVNRQDSTSIFSESLRSVRNAMHDSWVRVRGGETSTIHIETPSQSDAHTVEFEPSEASYGPMRQSHASARHEPRDGRSEDDIRQAEEEILRAPQGTQNYDRAQPEAFGPQRDFFGKFRQVAWSKPRGWSWIWCSNAQSISASRYPRSTGTTFTFISWRSMGSMGI